ncbi:MAG: hypothetical protein XD69_0922 [Clostridia bacterium 62_21]|nr:MAG: hypothetical protein XD69_0922 [Clostridia bacterium 62_21]HAG07261.1 hypothetical protein [Peptococcaceae bacterium]
MAKQREREEALQRAAKEPLFEFHYGPEKTLLTIPRWLRPITDRIEKAGEWGWGWVAVPGYGSLASALVSLAIQSPGIYSLITGKSPYGEDEETCRVLEEERERRRQRQREAVERRLALEEAQEAEEVRKRMPRRPQPLPPSIVPPPWTRGKESVRTALSRYGITPIWNPKTRTAEIGGVRYKLGEIPGTRFDPASWRHYVVNPEAFRKTVLQRAMRT